MGWPAALRVFVLHRSCLSAVSAEALVIEHAYRITDSAKLCGPDPAWSVGLAGSPMQSVKAIATLSFCAEKKHAPNGCVLKRGNCRFVQSVSQLSIETTRFLAFFDRRRSRSGSYG
jgi:hypothetical protein